jgi:hypothetical protein
MDGDDFCDSAPLGIQYAKSGRDFWEPKYGSLFCNTSLTNRASRLRPPWASDGTKSIPRRLALALRHRSVSFLTPPVVPLSEPKSKRAQCALSHIRDETVHVSNRDTHSIV